jgi:GAF domain-containing protein
MTLDPAYRLLTPHDEKAQQRATRLVELGIREEPDPEFDEFARQLAQATGAWAAMVNFLWPHGQYFAGLCPSSIDRNVDWKTDPFRRLACDHGYCIYTVTWRHALVIGNVADYHRFAVNPAVDATGVCAYMGAPLTDRDGMVLGTVCIVDTQPHPEWGLDELAWIKGQAAELSERIRQRAERPVIPEFGPDVPGHP